MGPDWTRDLGAGQSIGLQLFTRTKELTAKRCPRTYPRCPTAALEGPLPRGLMFWKRGGDGLTLRPSIGQQRQRHLSYNSESTAASRDASPTPPGARDRIGSPKCRPRRPAGRSEPVCFRASWPRSPGWRRAGKDGPEGREGRKDVRAIGGRLKNELHTRGCH